MLLPGNNSQMSPAQKRIYQLNVTPVFAERSRLRSSRATASKPLPAGSASP
jgi:hypothetical protein